jgi:hypothetical protein
MVSRSARTKLKAVLVIDVIIVAIAAGSYYYLQNQGLLAVAKPAEFTLSNLTINPLETYVGQSITISANVTNVGEEEGNCSANLEINDVLKETKVIQLLGRESKIVEFIDTENNEGNYSVKIGDLNGTFTVIALPSTSTVKVSNLLIDPVEAWAGESINISITASNIRDEASGYWLTFKVNNAIRATVIIQLSAGETKTVTATVNETSEGTYSVTVEGLNGHYYIVPTGKHTLQVVTTYSGESTFRFVIDGKSYGTPYSDILDVGEHTIVVPEIFTTPKGAVLKFLQWGDGDVNPTKRINLQSRILLVPNYLAISGHPSCPSLYIWNGTNYVYRTEVSSGTGYLGILDYFQNYTPVFAYSYPWSYLKLDKNQLQPKNGYYDMTLTQMWDELFYIDAVHLVVVDHAPNVDVFSTKGTYIYNLDGQGKIYTVSKKPSMPISAVNGEGENVLPQISKLDGVYTTGREFQWDTLQLNLGNLSSAKEIKLVVAGAIVYSSGQVQGEWASQFVNQSGVKPFPPPYMEVKDANGNWVRVPDNRQFPLVEVTPERFVVNLTGLFPTNDYSLRINTFFDTRFDYIAVDTTPQQNVIIQKINPAIADFTQVFETDSTSSGNFTRYGDVTELVRDADDEFVIGQQGDRVALKFNANELGPVPAGMERDYFVFVSCWFKVKGLPYLPFTVDPLPFHAMSCFPYDPATESYPYDAHLRYLLKYNTRVINVP